MNRKGISLIIEVLIILLLIGVIGTLSLPSYRRSMERHKGKEGEINLKFIYNAEKRYQLDNGKYCVSECDTLTNINKELGLDIQAKYFSYAITCPSGNETTEFTATATRNNEGQDCDGKIMTVDQSNGEVSKGDCPVWE